MKLTQKSVFRIISMIFMLTWLTILAAACSPVATTAFTLPATSTTAASAATTAALAATSATTSPTAAATTAAATTAAVTTAAVTQPTRLTGPFLAADLAVTVGNQSFTLLADAAPLLKILGDKFEKTEAESCVFEGLDKTFDYGYLQVYTVPKGNQDLLDGIYILDDRVQTARDIRVGDTMAEVVAAYGENTGEGSLIYNQTGDPENLADPSLTFVFEEDIVVAISYYSGSNTQGAGNGG